MRKCLEMPRDVPRWKKILSTVDMISWFNNSKGISWLFLANIFFLQFVPLNRNVCRCDITKKCNLKNIVLSQHFGGLSVGGGWSNSGWRWVKMFWSTVYLYLTKLLQWSGDCRQKVSWKWSNGVHRKEFLMECNSAFFLFQFKYFCSNATSAWAYLSFRLYTNVKKMHL